VVKIPEVAAASMVSANKIHEVAAASVVSMIKIHEVISVAEHFPVRIYSETTIPAAAASTVIPAVTVIKHTISHNNHSFLIQIMQDKKNGE
jgi:hypothetical protein